MSANENEGECCIPVDVSSVDGVKRESDSGPRDEEREEADHFEKIVNSFRYYRHHSMLKIRKDYLAYCRLPENHRKLLHPHYPKHLTDVSNCIGWNDKVLREILGGIGRIFENKNHEPDVEASQLRPASEFDMEKLQSTMKQVCRDWSEEGKVERDQCYKPLLEEIQRRFPAVEDRKHVRVLVPGAGLGRLALDFARLGFECQGNEFSLFMLFVSNFILNRCKKENCLTIYPWIHQTSNNLTYADRLRPISFPDVNPSDLPNKGSFSMAAGDFLEVYAQDVECWDCIATVFFLDTASNVLEYIDRIYRILKPNGVWINLGPLLYHFADMPNHNSIELPFEELRRIVLSVGFKIECEKTDVETTYTNNIRSMLQYKYKCVYFVCTK